MKECYGNYMEYPICQGHGSCTEKGCFSKTMTDKGVCDCIYKSHCHLLRQSIQEDIRREYGYRIEECDFYKLIKDYHEKNKQ